MFLIGSTLDSPTFKTTAICWRVRRPLDVGDVRDVRDVRVYLPSESTSVADDKRTLLMPSMVLPFTLRHIADEDGCLH